MDKHEINVLGKEVKYDVQYVWMREKSDAEMALLLRKCKCKSCQEEAEEYERRC